jgi:phage tail sheath protein FI
MAVAASSDDPPAIRGGPVPEYLSPGVYVEEVSFRSKSIEGVPTSTTGICGATRWGPVAFGATGQHPFATEPRLMTSYTEFERVYGGLEPLAFGAEGESQSYVAHAARAFFMNGGRRLYVTRAYNPLAGGAGVSTGPVAMGNSQWRGRWPGAAGDVLVESKVIRSGNVAFTHPVDANDPLGRDQWGVQAKRAVHGTLVEVTAPVAGAPAVIGNEPLDPTKLRVIRRDINRRQWFDGGAAPQPGDEVRLVDFQVTVTVNVERVDAYQGLAVHPMHPQYVGRVLGQNDPDDDDAVVWLFVDGVNPLNPTPNSVIGLAVALQGAVRLTGGNDGDKPQPDDLAGQAADPDNADVKATGLEALGEIDDIAIVALPDGSTYGAPSPTPADVDLCQQSAERLIGHAERERYRIAIVDPPPRQSMNEIRGFRGHFDSKYAALYHPWIEILAPPTPGDPGARPSRLQLPPSGFVAGIYARSDIERGVYKAPANEVVRGLTKFEVNINQARQDVLNPESINALRFFEGRGSRVWGARTLSSDPEWRYINVRRLFIFLEHSIDKATQWAVFEPNNERLWSNIRATVEDFLLVQWRDGALLGSKPEDAYFVRCDRSTMTQNDLDNGRLICLIGVAPVKPAEFVIFRIGQWTSDAKSA